MMDYINGLPELHSRPVPFSRLQEKEDLQQLADKFSAYVSYVRQLNQSVSAPGSADLATLAKVHDEQIANFKNIYEAELEKLRQDVEAGARDRRFLQTQCSNQQTSIGDLQNKLSHETDKNSRLTAEVNNLQNKVERLESELHAAQSKLQSQENVDRLKRCLDNLTREVDQWKHRYEHEQLTTRELESQLQQLKKKAEFYDQVHEQDIRDYKNRLDLASDTIISLEACLQEANKAPTNEVLKQVKEKVEAEFRRYQAEAEEQYSRNLSVLKVRIDSDAEALRKLSFEKSELSRKTGELYDKIRDLEGQVASLHHQKKTLEDTIVAERRQAEGNIAHLENNFRDAQNRLITKMNELINVRDFSTPLKSEIEALKRLIDEEENRLQVPLGRFSSTTVQPIILNADRKTTAYQSNFFETTENKTLDSHTSAPAFSNPQSQSDVKRAEEFSMPHNASQQPASLQNMVAAVSAPPGSFITRGYFHNSSYPEMPEVTSSAYPLEPSPPLDPFYIPLELQSPEEEEVFNCNFNANGGHSGGNLDLPEILLPMSGQQYNYNTLNDWNQIYTSPPLTSCPVGPIHTRAKPAAENYKTEDAGDTGNARNLKINEFQSSTVKNLPDDRNFQCFNKEKLITKSRPKSSPSVSLYSFHEDNDPSASAIGDLKIKEVSEDGRFVRLLNDGPTEYECSGYMIKQTIHGRPVAVFRFPSETKFPPDSTITVWSGVNDPSLHNPPTDFFWKESQKWETGPQCATVLCRPNGQACAWTTPYHRLSKDLYTEASGSKLNLKEETESYHQPEDENHSVTSNVGDGQTLTTLKVDFIGSRSEPAFIRREKRQPPSLFNPKHPHGNNPSLITHPHAGEARPLHLGNDNSTYSRQSRTQTVRPDPLPGQPYTGSPAQRIGSMTKRRARSCQASRSSSINESVALNKTTFAGGTSERPSSFSRPWNRLETGLKQICSQYNSGFFPPMPPPPQIAS